MRFDIKSLEELSSSSQCGEGTNPSLPRLSLLQCAPPGVRRSRRRRRHRRRRRSRRHHLGRHLNLVSLNFYETERFNIRYPTSE